MFLTKVTKIFNLETSQLNLTWHFTIIANDMQMMYIIFNARIASSFGETIKHIKGHNMERLTVEAEK